MRIFGRNDVFLIGGLAIAVWVVSSRQLGTLLDRAREIDHSRGLQLVPLLFILAAVFSDPPVPEARGDAGESDARRTRASPRWSALCFSARRLRTRSTAIRFGRSRPSIFRCSHRAAMPGPWFAPATNGSPLTPIGTRSRAARASAPPRVVVGDPDASSHAAGGDVHCLPLVAAGGAIGAIGISPDPPLTEAQRSVLAAAAALLAASVKNADLFRQVKENSARDALTACFNRRHFH